MRGRAVSYDFGDDDPLGAVPLERSLSKTPQNVIEEALRHPTKFVTEGELREQYNHVIVDIRSMAVLAAGLIVVLFVLAFVLPR